MWLRVTPETSFDPQKTQVVEIIEAGDQMWILNCHNMGSYVSDDLKGTIYYPITEDILKAAAAMAEAPCGCLFGCDTCKVKDAYRAAVEKAVKGA